MGTNTSLAKIDIQHAYRNIPVHMEDRILLVMQWREKFYTWIQYFNLVLFLRVLIDMSNTKLRLPAEKFNLMELKSLMEQWKYSRLALSSSYLVSLES